MVFGACVRALGTLRRGSHVLAHGGFIHCILQTIAKLELEVQAIHDCFCLLRQGVCGGSARVLARQHGSVSANTCECCDSVVCSLSHCPAACLSAHLPLTDSPSPSGCTSLLTPHPGPDQPRRLRPSPAQYQHLQQSHQTSPIASLALDSQRPLTTLITTSNLRLGGAPPPATASSIEHHSSQRVLRVCRQHFQHHQQLSEPASSPLDRPPAPDFTNLSRQPAPPSSGPLSAM